jgi:hypothetical protein
MDTFDIIVLNGRPGGGKSELIDFLKKAPLERRIERYHIGDFEEYDDFVWLWDKFVEDDLWEEIGEPRLYSRTVPHGYVQLEGDRVLDMLLRKFNPIVARTASGPDYYDSNSVFVELSRGVPDGGYLHAYEQLSEDILRRAAIVYISVSYEESLRRNEARYQAALAHSILAHKLPDEAQERFSAHQDFHELTGDRTHGHLTVKGIEVPFVVIPNEPELTDPEALDVRYGEALGTLWKLWNA